jgi:hypothetical protein
MIEKRVHSFWWCLIRKREQRPLPLGTSQTEKTEFDSRVNFFLFYGGHCAGIASNTRSRHLAFFLKVLFTWWPNSRLKTWTLPPAVFPLLPRRRSTKAPVIAAWQRRHRLADSTPLLLPPPPRRAAWRNYAAARSKGWSASSGRTRACAVWGPFEAGLTIKNPPKKIHLKKHKKFFFFFFF